MQQTFKMPILIKTPSDLPDDILALINEAQKVSLNAYNKYSKFLVGAAVRTKSGKIYTGTFLENSSFGLTICAEPAAIMNANSNGDFNIDTIAIVGGDPSIEGNEPITPCGRCRQIIFEASTVNNQDIDIYCSDLKLTKVLITTIYELLPLPFLKSNYSGLDI